ncbi:unnamed protein product [Enterobius vermicularis]|uniref:G domain-containing protein n=1 Tax=Enterobius vermicularis TaxID=51028 RepID=A0A0N4VFK6_ENTVE|nr:unnamed protein product [Enterobius vermicularis]
MAYVSVSRQELSQFSRNPHIRKIIIGGPKSMNFKVILLFGFKKAGKTSVISSVLNYLYDVKKYHNFRFVLEEDIQSTSDLVEYVVNNSVLQYSVTFVDTPGVLDKQGYSDTSSIIKEWYEELLKEGKFCLDAITIVLKSDEQELTWPYIHELAAVKKMFGDDLRVNVLPVITYSEILPQPTAVKAMAYANITFLEYYKVNSAGFAQYDGKISKSLYSDYFEDGLLSFKRYFSVRAYDLEQPLLSVKTKPCLVPAGT